MGGVRDRLLRAVTVPLSAATATAASGMAKALRWIAMLEVVGEVVQATELN